MDPDPNYVIFPFDSVDPFDYVVPERDHAEPQLNTPNTDQSCVKDSHRSKNWTSNEEVSLCKAWAITLLDPDEGDSQKQATYWGRIYFNFKGDVEDSTGLQTICNQSACERRWAIIQHDFNKFCGAYDHATSTHFTGRVQLDVVSPTFFSVS